MAPAGARFRAGSPDRIPGQTRSDRCGVHPEIDDLRNAKGVWSPSLGDHTPLAWIRADLDLLGLLDHQVAGLVRVDGDARTHRRCDRRLPEVATLRGRWLESVDLVEGCGVVLDQRLIGEGRLADDEVKVRVPVDAELDLSALDVRDGLGDI